MGVLILIALVVLVGTRACDNLRVRQQEVILRKLPEPERLAYYDVLRRRMRRVVVLRAVALISLAIFFYTMKYHFTG
jgi:hypothetical protein